MRSNAGLTYASHREHRVVLAIPLILAVAGLCLLTAMMSDDGYSNVGDEITIGDFVYTIIYEPESPSDSDRGYEVEIKKYNGEATELVLDSTIEHDSKTFTVTGIGELAFFWNRTLDRVTLPDSIKTIGTCAFEFCNITYIDLSAVEVLGTFAFFGCDQITSIVLPESLREYGEAPFKFCDGLVDVTLPIDLDVSKNGGLFFECGSIKNFHFTKGGGIGPDYELNHYGSIVWRNNNNEMNFYFEEGIKRIGDNMFRDTKNVEYMDLPQGLESIGEASFYNMDGLKRMVLPDSVKTIGGFAFEFCKNMTYISLPKDLEEIPWRLFYGCTSLDGIELPKGLKKLGSLAFADCESLTSIEIPDGITVIDTHTFIECSILSHVVLPNGLTSIGNSAFSDCFSLEELDIPQTVTKIDATAFMNCTSLKRMDLPFGLETITKKLFAGCHSMEYVGLPDSLISIEESAFNGCKSLKGLDMPASAVQIGQSAFYGCESIEHIEFGTGLRSINANTFSGCFSLERIVLPDGLMSIAETAFKDCMSLSALVIPDTVTYIGVRAFGECSNLKSVTLPDALDKIEKETFYNCISLQSIEMPSKIEYIENDAFAYCMSLTSIDLGDGLTIIAEGVFRGCAGLSSITLTEGIKSIGREAFIDCASLRTIDLRNVTDIHEAAFMNCISLESLTIGDDMILGPHAFRGCTGLKDLTIPMDFNLADMMYGPVFQGCVNIERIEFTFAIEHWMEMDDQIRETSPWYISGRSLKTVVLPEGAVSVPAKMFKGATGLETVELSSSILNIGASAFEGCSNLKTFAGNDGLEEIGDGAFKDCTSLVSADLPDTVTKIGCNAFQNCQNLRTFRIPDLVNTVRAYTFDNCWRLEEVVWSPALKTLEPYSFSNCLVLLKIIVLNEGSMSIGENAFCDSVTWRIDFISDGIEFIPELYKDEDMTQPLRPVELSEGFHGTIWVLQRDMRVIITFKPNGGLLPEGVEDWKYAVKGYPIGELPVPSLPGYYFQGWYTEIQEGRLVNSESVLNEDTTLYAHWTPEIYTITFMDGDEVWKTLDVPFGQWIDTSDLIPTKEGHIFKGWDPALPYLMPRYDIVTNIVWELEEYTVTWKNWNGETLETDLGMKYGTMPTYDGDTPVKEPSVYHVFTFVGWNPEVGKVTRDITYTAEYEKSDRPYDVTFVNWDGSVIAVYQVPYGQTPSYSGETPTREKEVKYTYIFVGWTPEFTPVVGEATYTAVYEQVLSTYTIRFVNHDGTELQSSVMEYGRTPVYEGETPTKEGDVQYSYVFTGWSPDIIPVEGDETYTAVFEQVINSYTIYFRNYDMTLLYEYELLYDHIPTYGGETPEKESDGDTTYRFNGWYPNFVPTVMDTTYYATFVPTEWDEEFTIRFVDWDGRVLQTAELPHGDIPAYTGPTPSRDNDEGYTYRFVGWSPLVSAVIGDTDYTAMYEEFPRAYTITFMCGDDEFHSAKQYYGSAVSPPGIEPTRADSNGYRFHFVGWADLADGTKVTGDMTFVALFVPEPVSYPDIVDRNVTFDTVDDTLMFGESLIDKTREHFENGTIDSVRIGTANGYIEFDKDAFFVLGYDRVTVSMTLENRVSIPAPIRDIVGDGIVYGISVGEHHNFGEGTLSIAMDIDLPPNVVPETMRVLHFDGSNDGSYEIVDHVYRDGEIHLKTDGLSYFAVVFEYGDEPEGSDWDPNRIIGTVIIVMFVIGAMGLLVVRRH